MRIVTTKDKVKYKIDDFGIITQLNPEPFEYNNEYIDKYMNDPSYVDGSLKLSLIRYAFMVGAIGYTPDSLLDIGYGNGDFLRICQNFIPNIYGFDIAPTSLNGKVKLLNHLPFDYIVDTFEYDVVCFYDSLEHFQNADFIKKLKTKYISISLPHCKSPTNTENFEEWFNAYKHRKPNEHIYHFCPESLELFFIKNGYYLVSLTNVEDYIRKPSEDKPNIINAVFKKRIL